MCRAQRHWGAPSRDTIPETIPTSCVLSMASTEKVSFCFKTKSILEQLLKSKALCRPIYIYPLKPHSFTQCIILDYLLCADTVLDAIQPINYKQDNIPWPPGAYILLAGEQWTGEIREIQGMLDGEKCYRGK